MCRCCSILYLFSGGLIVILQTILSFIALFFVKLMSNISSNIILVLFTNGF